MGEEGKIVESRVIDLERYRVLGARAAQSGVQRSAVCNVPKVVL
jgi:hypothetical protein